MTTSEASETRDTAVATTAAAASDSDRLATRYLDACCIPGPAACGEILLVGEDNPLSMDPRYALYHEPRGCAGHRLQSRILGVLARQTYLPIWRTNLCAGGWDAQAADGRAESLARAGAPWRTIVLLGSRVAGAFDRATRIRLRPFEVAPFGQIALISLPHPSGRNPAWNDPARIALARSILHRSAPGIPRGETDGAARDGTP